MKLKKFLAGVISSAIVLTSGIIYQSANVKIPLIGSEITASAANNDELVVGKTMDFTDSGSHYNCSGVYWVISDTNVLSAVSSSSGSWSFTVKAISPGTASVTQYWYYTPKEIDPKTHQLVDGTPYLESCFWGTVTVKPKQTSDSGSSDSQNPSPNGKYYDMGIYYQEYKKYVEISYCDNSAGLVEIPAEINGKPVTEIAEKAFYECDKIKELSIPGSIKTIEKNAFYNCTNLKSVYIDDINILLDIDFKSLSSNPLYNGADLYIDDELIEDLDFPKEVTEINYGCFAGCRSIKNVTFHEGIKSVGNCSFCKCDNIKELKIPNSSIKLEIGSFLDCKNLKTVIFEEGRTEIDSYTCFFGTLTTTDITSNVETVILPDSIKIIGEDAFSTCESLKNINIPNGVTNIGKYAFRFCTNLTNITIPSSVTSIGHGAFWNCEKFTDIIIPNSVTSIGDYAFRYCRNLKNIVIPRNVESIGTMALADCTTLENVIILNPECEIADDSINNVRVSGGRRKFTGTIYGYKNSTAQKFAESVVKINGRTLKEAYRFDTIENAPADILPEEKPALSGDTNGDGSISAADIVMLQQYLTKKSAMTNSTCADINGDGRIDVFDGILLRRLILKSK